MANIADASSSLPCEKKTRSFESTAVHFLPSPPFLPRPRVEARASASRFVSKKLRSATEGKTQTLLATVGVGATIGGVTLVVGFGSAPFTAGLGTAAATGIALGITVAGAVAAKLTTIALDPVVRKARNFAAIYRRASKAEMGTSMDATPNPAIEEMVSLSLLKGQVAAIEYVVDHYLLAEEAMKNPQQTLQCGSGAAPPS